MHKRILLRARKGPFDVLSPEATLNTDAFAQNVGNLVFSHAAYKLLSTDQTEITPNKLRVNPRDAGIINEQYDVFVVPLANAFRRSFVHRLDQLTKLIERLKIPVIVLGVGAQTTINGDRERLRPIDELVKRFTKAVLDRSATIGVRGEITESYLRSLGFRDVDVIGCPSMFMHGDNLHVEKKKFSLDPNDSIAINISPYVKKMGKVVLSHHRRYPNLRYIPQDLKSLETLLWGDAVADRGKQSDLPIYTSHPLYQEDKVRIFVDPWTWMSYLSDFQFAFGTRIHGNITALISGVPSYVFAHDSRTLELARYFGIPHRPIKDVGPDVDAAQLFEEADYSALNNGHKERFATMVDFLRRNGLNHAFANGDSAQRFDERVRQTQFPPAVRPVTGAASTELVERMRWLKDNNDELRRMVKELATNKLVSAVRRQTWLVERLPRFGKDASR